jgi:hypothetical protein
MLRICDHPGCTTFTLGSHCPAHEPPLTPERFPRGRPFPRRRARLPAGLGAAGAGPDPGGAPPVSAVSFGGGT